MSRQISLQQAQAIMEQRFKGRYVKFSYPGYPDVHGRCDRISIGTGVRDAGLVLIIIGDKLYRCSPEALKDCLTLLKPDNGDTHTGGAATSAGT